MTAAALPTIPAELIHGAANQLMVHLPFERQARIVMDPAIERLISADERKMGELPAVENQSTADTMRNFLVEVKKDFNCIEAARTLVKEPFLTICRMIDEAARGPKERLQAIMDDGKEQQRVWIAAEEARRAAEETRRRAAESVATKASTRPTAAIIAPVLNETIDAPLTTRSDIEITDYEQIPAEYWVVDMVKLRHDLLTLHKTVPGARVVTGQDVVVRP